MKFKLVTIITCLIVGTLSETDTSYRLNSPVRPKSYSIAITPYFDTGDDRAFTFDGEVSIVIITDENNISQIKLHAEDLEINATDIAVSSSSTAINLNPANPIVFDKKYTFLYINLETSLEAGKEYTLAISYRGPIRSDLAGFYKAAYKENGVKKWFGVTQLESTNARKVFPSFDEPSYKATFTLTIDRPAHYSQTLTNMKILGSPMAMPNGYVREIFHPSPVMPTYLVAFLVSEFESGAQSPTGTNEHAIFSRPQAKNQSQIALDFGIKIVEGLGEYFGIDYYSTSEFLNLNHAAITDFAAGAMENWGLITYREEYLLFDEAESDPVNLNKIATIIAHETTHQWFGNLVTCHWWSDTWLNEAFANFFENFITSQIDPELGADVNSLLYAQRAYVADEVKDAPPISNQNVNSPSEISGHFGSITYQKGGAVLRMVQNLIGASAFQSGLREYLKANNLSVGYPETLYKELDQAVGTSSLVNITEFMGYWISTPGHPVLKVEVEDGIVHLEQERFFGKSGLESDVLYPIPLTYATSQNPNFTEAAAEPKIIMSERTLELNLTNEFDVDDWIIFNIMETGFYRVNYSKELWAAIANALKSEKRTVIHTFNRAKIIDDIFVFLKADAIEFSTVRDVIEFLKDEDEYAVWTTAVSDLRYLLTTYNGEDVVREYVLSLVNNIVDKLGYNRNESDNFLTTILRREILYLACQADHQGCIEHAVTAFKDLRENGIAVEPSLRQVVYCYGIAHGSAEDFEFLESKLLNTNVATEAVLIRSALGCSKDKAMLKKYLNSPTDTESTITAAYDTVPFTSVLKFPDNVDVTIEVLKENYTSLSNAVSSMTSIVSAVASAAHTSTQFNDFETWLNSCEECPEDLKTAATETLELAKEEVQWAKEHLEEIQKQLRNHAFLTTPSLTLFALCLFTVVIVFEYF